MFDFLGWMTLCHRIINNQLSNPPIRVSVFSVFVQIVCFTDVFSSLTCAVYCMSKTAWLREKQHKKLSKVPWRPDSYYSLFPMDL